MNHPTSDLPYSAAARLQGLREAAGLLWDGGVDVGPRVDGKRTTMLVVPSTSRPRLAVPADEPRAAAAAVLQHGHALSRADRVQRRVLAMLLRTGAGQTLFRTVLRVDPESRSGLLEHLSKVLGTRVVASMPLTPARANRKPVLHLLDSRGRTVAFVKVGVNPLTCELVRHETAVLEHLARAGLTTMQVPQVLHAQTWRDLQLLVLSPLPTERTTDPATSVLDAAMHELAQVSIPDQTATGVDYVDGLVERMVAAQSELSPQDQDTLLELIGFVRNLAEHVPAEPLRLGTWHGDWTPWNCRQRGAKLLVWDWERCRPRTPAGFDAVHYRLQLDVVERHVRRVDAARQCLLDSPRLLQTWQPEYGNAVAVVILYLAELALRYLVDGQREAGAPGGDVREWILPTLRTAQSSSAPGTIG